MAKRKCKLRHLETGEEVMGMMDDDRAYLANGCVANCQYWEIVDPVYTYFRFFLTIATLIGAVFVGFIFWGEQ